MHNILTLKQLKFPYNYTTTEGVIETLERGIYPQGFEESAKSVFASMTTPETFNGEYAIQYIKR